MPSYGQNYRQNKKIYKLIFLLYRVFRDVGIHSQSTSDNDTTNDNFVPCSTGKKSNRSNTNIAEQHSIGYDKFTKTIK